MYEKTCWKCTNGLLLWMYHNLIWRDPEKITWQVFMLTQLPEAREKEKSKTGFGQVKIMKEFVWINRERPPQLCYLNLK